MQLELCCSNRITRLELEPRALGDVGHVDLGAGTAVAACGVQHHYLNSPQQRAFVCDGSRGQLLLAGRAPR